MLNFCELKKRIPGAMTAKASTRCGDHYRRVTKPFVVLSKMKHIGRLILKEPGPSLMSGVYPWSERCVKFAISMEVE
jgi:hypothetical protein